jgi:acetyl esterase/lipase
MERRSFYGPATLQFGDLRVPESVPSSPVAIVIHGGFWRNRYGLDYIVPVCEALTAVGIATWNLEYRRIGDSGGGWPGTFEDVSAGAEHLRSLSAEFNLDLNRVVTVGHSAGGHLAFWLACEKKWIAGAVSLAGVLDLRRTWELGLSDNVVAQFLGGSPIELPARYNFASPLERLPIGIRQKLFHGTADTSVPYEISKKYAQAAKSSGDDAELVAFEGAGHFEVVDPRTKEFERIRETIAEMLR